MGTCCTVKQKKQPDYVHHEVNVGRPVEHGKFTALQHEYPPANYYADTSDPVNNDFDVEILDQDDSPNRYEL